MGGCRCTYRSCTVKTDGKTHMFHYPVFDKVRCHQWLINARRLEFFNLKVSQLKNRVVCQHHFKNENFMNFKKDKLTFDAVPTEDGPYCDPVKYEDKIQDQSKYYSFVVDDIDNDYFAGCDKKANFSLKYGDFLTNFDLSDIEKTEKQNNAVELTNNDLDLNQSHEKKVKFVNDESSHIDVTLPCKSEKVTSQPVLVVPPFVNTSNVNVRLSDSGKCDNRDVLSDANKDISLNKNGKKEIVKKSLLKDQQKITIISEKKITDPVSITGKFEPVSPSFVLNVSKIKRNIKPESQNDNMTTLVEHKNLPTENIEKKIVNTEPIVNEEAIPQSPPLIVIQDQSNVPEKPVKLSLLKPRVPPERVEAIKKKRKFNMKLRDFIESCLDKLENSDKATEEISTEENTKLEQSVQHEDILKETPVYSNSAPNSQDFTIAYLESRMKKMENTLLQKIEQNSTKISEIKKMYASETKATINSRINEEAHKRQLFQEISEYLSPSTKNLVYEELFINKFSLGDKYLLNTRKRRKRNI